MDQHSDRTDPVELATEIVAAFVSHNRVQHTDLPNLIGAVHQALVSASAQGAGEPGEPEQPKATPQQIRRSITPDHLVSFEDGKHYRTLRRHLALRGLTPQAYREKWGLAADYPLVAPSYAKQRSELAKALGLGQQRRKGLAKVSAADALKVEALAEAAESPAGEATRDDEVIAEVITEAIEPTGKSKRIGSTRGRKSKAEPGGG